jgi:hypothetical protein
MAKHIWTIASVLCTHILDEKDGSLSVIRIIDRITIPKPESPPLLNNPVPVVQLNALFVLRGDEDGDHKFQVRINSPSKPNAQEGPEMPIRIDGPGRGLNLNTNVLLELGEEGMYWIDVYLDGEVSVRVPVEVVYQSSQVPSIQKPQ